MERHTIEVDGGDVHKVLLYLTNKQARKFNFDDIDKVMTALDIVPRPKLVIKLFESRDVLAKCFGALYPHIADFRPFKNDTNYGFDDRTYGYASYDNSDDMQRVEQELVGLLIAHVPSAPPGSPNTAL